LHQHKVEFLTKVQSSPCYSWFRYWSFWFLFFCRYYVDEASSKLVVWTSVRCKTNLVSNDLAMLHMHYQILIIISVQDWQLTRLSIQ